MAELNKGFEPFTEYNAGNDYNPLGYGTAKVMKQINDSVFALSAVPNGSIDHTGMCGGKYEYVEYKVIRNVVDTNVNHDEFINGIWHATSDAGDIVYKKPEIVEFKVDLPELIAIENYTPITNLNITSKINPGTADKIKTDIKLVANGKELVIYSTDKDSFNLDIEDAEILSIINDLIAKNIYFDIIAETSDSESTVEDKKTIKPVHLCYYGWMDKYDIIPENISQVDPAKGRCSKAIDYLSCKAFFGSFYPEDNNMYIATPVELGNAKAIGNGAAEYSIGTKNTDFIQTVVKINNVNYYLYILQYTNHSTYNLGVIFNKGN